MEKLICDDWVKIRDIMRKARARRLGVKLPKKRETMMMRWARLRLKDKDLEGTPLGDFYKDVIRDEPEKDFFTEEEFYDYLLSLRAPDDIRETGRIAWRDWASNDPKAVVDGMSRKAIDQLRKATRQVWSWSTPKKLCLKRATDKKGFGRCELCKKKVPKLYADHIIPVGAIDEGYFKRLFCPSNELQALCAKCHTKKTNQERKELARKKDLAE